jgi:hypothetical protein
VTGDGGYREPPVTIIHECPRHSSVEFNSLTAGDAGVDSIAHHGMGKEESIKILKIFNEQSSCQALFNCIQHRIGTKSAYLPQQVDRDLLAQRRRHMEDVLAERRESLHPAVDQCANPCRGNRGESRNKIPLIPKLDGLLVELTQEFTQEEGIALGGTAKIGGVIGEQLNAFWRGNRPYQAAYLTVVKGTEALYSALRRWGQGMYKFKSLSTNVVLAVRCHKRDVV